MVKQKKNLNLKTKLRYRKLFKSNKTNINPMFLSLKRPNFILKLKSTQNNVFCTVVNSKNKKTMLVTSAGIEKVQVSKKNLIFGVKNILINFIKKMKYKIKNKNVNILVNITAPLRVKILILRLLKLNLKGFFITIYTNPIKCFNGCKPPKKKRKKQRGLRVFK